MRDPSVVELLPLIELEAVPGQHNYTAYLDVYLEDGQKLHAEVQRCLGHPENPLRWDDLKTKFEGLVEPVLGAERAAAIHDAVRGIESHGGLGRLLSLIGADALISSSAAVAA